jgi:hypothetical protein
MSLKQAPPSSQKPRQAWETEVFPQLPRAESLLKHTEDESAAQTNRVWHGSFGGAPGLTDS